jgi:hypothetical protein
MFEMAGRRLPHEGAVKRLKVLLCRLGVWVFANWTWRCLGAFSMDWLVMLIALFGRGAGGWGYLMFWAFPWSLATCSCERKAATVDFTPYLLGFRGSGMAWCKIPAYSESVFFS